MDVRIRDHQHIMACGWQHVDQVSNLAVRSVLPGIDHQCDVHVRKSGLESAHHGNRWIGRILDSEHNLKVRKVLPAQGRQCLLQQRLIAVQRLQHRHRRPNGGGLPTGLPCLTGERRDQSRRHQRLRQADTSQGSRHPGQGRDHEFSAPSDRSAILRRRLATSASASPLARILRKSERCTATRLMEPSSSTSTARQVPFSSRIT